MLTKVPLEKSLVAKKPLYSKSDALVEAHRCLYCYDAPCIKACPTAINIPSFIKAIADGNVDHSAHVILRENILGHSCAQVCPVEVLCAGDCVLHQRGEEAINIGRLQQYATHKALQKHSLESLLGPKAPATGRRVACVGAGPASLALAGLLVLKGHTVQIFEARALLGGLNATGIAPYKMHFDEAQKEIRWLMELGVVVHENHPVDAPESLLADFDAVFLGVGIGDDTLLPQLPDSHPRIFGATDIIRRIKTDADFSLEGIHSAHIIGGGNTAVDIAHELALLGVNDVTMVYRRARKDMSAYKHEVDGALKDGVQISFNQQLVSVEALPSGQLKLFMTSDHKVTDLLVIAIGQNQGVTEIDPATQRTKHPRIWAGGDCTNGGKEVVNAVADAKVAAESMHTYLTSLTTESAHA